jgi:predicted amidohydrolase YtcJ
MVSRNADNIIRVAPMKKMLLALLILVLLVTIGIPAAFHFNKPSLEDYRAFYNGNIITMNPLQPNAQAMLLMGDSIEKLGTTEEILALLPLGYPSTDLNGNTMIPGILDAHGHFPGEGLHAVAADLNSPPIGNKLTISDIESALTEYASKTDKGDWIRGFGFDDTTIAEQRFITVQELDAISTEHPIFVFHISAHMAVVNSFALELLNIDKYTLNPEGGEYQKDKNGELTGLLLENAHHSARQAALNFSTLDALSVINFATNRYLKQGITTAQNGMLHKENFDLVSMSAKLGLYDIRQIIWPSVETAEAILSGEKDTDAFNDKMFKLGAVKIVADGSIQGYTGYLTHPYHVPAVDRKDDYAGYPLQARQTLVDIVEKYHQAGMQIAIHGNGDASIDDIIFAIESAQNKRPNPDARFIVVHSQMVRDDQLMKYKELGITPSYFNAHVYYWGDRHREIFIGPDRAKRISPLATTEQLGIKFTTHSDSPVVPMTPWLNAWSAVTRQTSSGQTLGLNEAVSRYSALTAMTIDAAWQVFEEQTRGSLEPGKFADFVILEKDPLASNNNLKDPVVLSTWIGGIRKYKLVP